MKQLTLLFLVRDDEILLAMKKRGVGEGRWNGCGGKVEPGETIEQATVRETEEEIGVTPTSFDKVGVHVFSMPGQGEWETHTYICTDWKGEPIETEEMAPRWFKQSEIPYADMWQDDIVWLPLVLNGKKLRTKFAFDEHDNMVTAELTLVKDFD